MTIEAQIGIFGGPHAKPSDIFGDILNKRAEGIEAGAVHDLIRVSPLGIGASFGPFDLQRVDKSLPIDLEKPLSRAGIIPWRRRL